MKDELYVVLLATLETFDFVIRILGGVAFGYVLAYFVAWLFRA